MARGRTLFISDLHLDATDPTTLALFRAFLDKEAAASDALYILGDLFESWIGDDDDDATSSAVRDALRALTAGGVPCFIQHGNRDFLLGSAFMAASGCTLLSDPAVLVIGGRRFVLSHGDMLCTEDRGYQRFRSVVRNAAVQKCWHLLSLPMRRRFAALARRRSHAYTRRAPESIMDVTPAAAAELLHASDGEVLVHGHTHRPQIHGIEVAGSERKRIVLGDWPVRARVVTVDAAGGYCLQPLRTDGTIGMS